MNREVVFEYLDNGERKSIHFVLDEISNSDFSFMEYQTCHIFLDIISLSGVWLLRIDN